MVSGTNLLKQPLSWWFFPLDCVKNLAGTNVIFSASRRPLSNKRQNGLL